MQEITRLISQALGISLRQTEQTLNLLNEGATIPFIARYRKEATGGLDEVQIAEVARQGEKFKELEHRKEYILQTIEEQGKLTDDLRARISSCWDATVLEDIYLPYKPKRKTRAEVARKRGLEPLADAILHRPNGDPEQYARKFLSKEVASIEDALQGARDILAEKMNEDERVRNTLRQSFERTAIISSRVVKSKMEEAMNYRTYFDFSEPLHRCTSHRLLAIRRGESEGFLRVDISPRDDEACMERLLRGYPTRGKCGEQIVMAMADAYKRLLKPSIETEFATASKKHADEEAIRVFASNLSQLLLAAPLGQKRIMGIDPGFRTGCKVVCLDEQGNLLHNETIFPHPPRGERMESLDTLETLMDRFRIEAVAIGNGTAGRETEDLVRMLHRPGMSVFLVSEDGASVYSASKIAREEFPDHDVTVRGAVSIGRRLADPLAELVKIDAKSIGVGQYQHDVEQTELKHALDLTVERCVNTVGVNLNTASKHLLTYISGLGPALAQNIVNYRTEHGPFSSRQELQHVPRLGAKAFEQCAGFLRIPGATNPLDNTAVHPERYALVRQMAKDAGCNVQDLIASAEKRKGIDLQRYCSDTVGMPTLTDIMQELSKPGRDPRGENEEFSFDDTLHSIDDLQEGMILQGIVSNITNFGCFVDLGIKTKGLVHISQLSDKFVRDPMTVVHVQQKVMVKVIEIDFARNRIALSMKGVVQR
ncbi:MAG: Tex family protein [Bacteroidaceae bacterium]|nr:Tex family protein [Bacteroidaceae bacterium]